MAQDFCTVLNTTALQTGQAIEHPFSNATKQNVLFCYSKIAPCTTSNNNTETWI